MLCDISLVLKWRQNDTMAGWSCRLVLVMLHVDGPTSSSCMRFISHNWSATKQRLHPQSVADISRHSVLSGDRIRQCETSSGSRHRDTDQCL